MVVVYRKQQIYFGRGINNSTPFQKFSSATVKKQLTLNNIKFLRSIGLRPRK